MLFDTVRDGFAHTGALHEPKSAVVTGNYTAGAGDRTANFVEVPIERVAASAGNRIAGHFAKGLPVPLIVTGALADWPAWGKWSTDFFAREYGDDLGLIPLSFSEEQGVGKAVRMRDFIAHLGGTAFSTPGFWVDAEHFPVEPPADIDGEGWSLRWEALKIHPELRADIGDYPDAFGNLIACLPSEVANLVQSLSGAQLFSIYISRDGTVTPFHFDIHSTVGSLAQFEGEKSVSLISPEDAGRRDISGFDPDGPDFDSYPDLAGCAVHSGTIVPGEMLVIPPNWWHHVRSIGTTVTLSHNFATPRNISAYLRGLIGRARQMDPATLARKLAKFAPEEGD